MSDPNKIEQMRDHRRVFFEYPLPVVCLSIIAIAITFLLADSSLVFAYKLTGFSVIVAAFLVICGGLYVRQRRIQAESQQFEQDTRRNDAVERSLEALDEAREFFSGSLQPADTFRLVSSKISDLAPFKSIRLYLLNEIRTHLRVAEAGGACAEDIKGQTQAYDEGLAGQAYLNKRVEVDGYLMLDESQELGSSVAIPLCRGTEVFGILEMSFDADFDMDTADLSIFEAIGVRVSPMVLAAIAFERSRLNALTDATTDLPNERAFYMVLEGHIAESIRKREERPLTILAMDIKNFDEINQKYGHVAGDQVLNFVAMVIKENLRQMDFVARSIGDEYLAVLPTATKEISHDVIARVHSGFFGRKLKVADNESIEIVLNIGWAEFGSDGETAGQLLSSARMRKEQSKSTLPSKVVWFPQELVT